MHKCCFAKKRIRQNIVNAFHDKKCPPVLASGHILLYYECFSQAHSLCLKL